jgi:hypothetical protein
MSNAGKLIKGMLKAKKESVMGKLGDAPYEDPMEPWSAKYAQPVKEESLNEDSLLIKYIKSLGFNPEFMSFAQRSSYARSNAFKRYKSGHTFDREKQNLNREDVELDEGKEDKIKQLKQDHATAVHWSKNETSPQKREAARQKAEKIKQHLATQYKQSVTEGAPTEQLDEAGTGLLMSFIKSKGLNPLTMDGNQKKAYSRSSEFRIFKMHHMKETSGMGERGDDWNEEKKIKVKKVQEEADAKDTVTMDIPLLIRVLEYAREDAKTDMDLHKVVENLINMRGEGALSMDMYDKIVAIKEEIERIDELKKQDDNMEIDSHITREDLRKWFSKTDPEGDWKRINSKGEVAGPCAREPGEPKPKCMSKEKRAELSKSERAAAVATKRKHDPVADRAGKGGKPINVSNYGKGKLSEEEVEQMDEKNKPTNPSLWSRAKSMARSKFDVYPSAYANGWASKWYKSKGGGWKSVSEETELKEGNDYTVTVSHYKTDKTITKHDYDVKNANDTRHAKNIAINRHTDKHGIKQGEQIYSSSKDVKPMKEDVGQHPGRLEDSPMSATNSVKAMESQHRKNNMKSARIIKSIYKKKVRNEGLHDWEKTDKGGNTPTAKITMQGGTTMTGKPRDTVEIEPVLKTRPNSQNNK